MNIPSVPRANATAACNWLELIQLEPFVPKLLSVKSCVSLAEYAVAKCCNHNSAAGEAMLAYHALWVCNEVGANVAPVKLHALHHIQVVLSSSGLLHGHHALSPHTSHGIADQLSNLHQRTSWSAVAAHHIINNANYVQYIKAHHNTQADHAAIVDMSTQGKSLGAGP